MEGPVPTRVVSNFSTCSHRSFPECRLVTPEDTFENASDEGTVYGEDKDGEIGKAKDGPIGKGKGGEIGKGKFERNSSDRFSRQLVDGHSFLINEQHWQGRARIRAAQVLKSQLFDKAVGAIIIMNSVCIGVELSFQLEGRRSRSLDILEHVFLGVYSVELGLRFFVQRHHCLKDNWVRFDCMLVCVGITTTWAIAVMEHYLGDPDTSVLNEDDSRAGSIKMLMVLRIMRLVRLARTMRLLVKFHNLGTLVRGLLASGSTMCYTVLLLITLLYVFACAGIQLVSVISLDVNIDMDAVVEEVIDLHFSSVPIAMLTLVQFVCLDSIASIYKPLCEWDLRFAAYFMACILVIGIVLMNLITAVVVEGAMEQASQDREALKAAEDLRKRRLIRDLRKMFIRLDEDDSGCVSRTEIQQMSEEDRALLSNVMTTTDPEEIFAAIDVDDSGTIDITEFCDGIWQVAISKAPIEMKRLEKHMQKMMRDSAAREESMRDVFLGELREIKRLLRPPPPPPDRERGASRSAAAAGEGPLMLSPVPEGRKPGAPASFEQGDVSGGTAGSPAAAPWAQELASELQEAADVCVHQALTLRRISEAGAAAPFPAAPWQIPEDPPSPPMQPLHLEASSTLHVLPQPPAPIGYCQASDDGLSNGSTATPPCSALMPENPRRIIKQHLTAAQRQLAAAQRARQQSA